MATKPARRSRRNAATDGAVDCKATGATRIGQYVARTRLIAFDGISRIDKITNFEIKLTFPTILGFLQTKRLHELSSVCRFARTLRLIQAD